MNKLYTYDNVMEVSIRPKWGSTDYSIYGSDNFYGCGKFKGKMLFVQDNGDNVAAEIEMQGLTQNQVPVGKKLFISPSSKIPRDVVRRTYTITYKKDDADYIILPTITKSFQKLEYSAMYLWHSSADNTDTLLLCSTVSTLVEKNIPIEKRSNDAVLDKICLTLGIPKEEVTVIAQKDYFSDDPLQGATQTVFGRLVPKCDEYREILESTRRTPYAFDCRLSLDTPTKITPEMLWVLFRERNEDIVAKSLFISDWREYPVTVSAFLLAKLGHYASCSSAAYAYLKEHLRFDSVMSASKDIIIEPKDLDMLQGWIFKELGVDADNGLVDLKTYSDLNDVCKKFCRKKVAVKKIKITEPISLQSIKQ